MPIKSRMLTGSGNECSVAAVVDNLPVGGGGRCPPNPPARGGGPTRPLLCMLFTSRRLLKASGYECGVVTVLETLFHVCRCFALPALDTLQLAMASTRRLIFKFAAMHACQSQMFPGSGHECSVAAVVDNLPIGGGGAAPPPPPLRGGLRPHSIPALHALHISETSKSGYECGVVTVLENLSTSADVLRCQRWILFNSQWLLHAG